MEEYNMIIAGVIGSVITLFITAVIDFCKQRYVSKLEMKKLVFQRQTDATEKVMSFLQEGVDCYRMMQMACDEINEKYNPVTWEKFVRSSEQANKLYGETGARLNPIYLYYDFSEIEGKYKSFQANQDMNNALTKIGRLEQQASDLRNNGISEESEELKEIRTKIICLYRELSTNLETHINTIVAMQIKLRNKYSKYRI